MQRLFSTFPNNWPGVGLLLLRLGLGIVLVYFGAVAPPRNEQDLIAAAGGIFLLGGLWTPVMGTAVALDKLWIVMRSPSRADTWFQIFLVVLCVSVAMLGPGAWSIDARLFGRTRLDFDGTRRRRR
jgi:putative oxidoreductase